MVFGAMLKTFVNRMMMCISDRWRGYILTIVLFFISSIQLFSQTPNVEESNTICDVKNNTYTFTSGTPRVGFWEVIEGAGVFSNPNSHVNTTITNIAYGKNVYYYWDNSYSMVVPEHVLTILNTKAYAGPDAVQCLPNTTYQLNASDPAEFPGSSGTWTVTQGTGTFSNVNDPKAIVTGLSVGINRFKWTQKSLPGGCGNSSDEVQITIVNTPPNAFAGSDQTICVGQSATISAPAGAGYTYLWSTGATTQSITVTPGVSTNYQVTVTNSNSCTASDDVDIFVDEINFYNLTAVDTKYCLGGTGVTLTLSGSEIGVNYQLKNGALNIGGLVPGTGFELKWINTTAGSYTVEAINSGTGCKETMNGTINVSSNPLPTTFNLTASSLNHCSHTSGVSLTLSGSENGANFQYQLFKNGAPLGVAVIGTGGALVWNNITAGNYYVTATNTLTGCSQNMTGTPAIVSVISPSLFTVAGSGEYCELSGGLPVTLNGSELGMNYQLIKDGSNSGVAKAGSGLGLSWNGNLQGTYTILASNVAGTCTRMMSSNAVLTQKALPSVFNVTAVQTSYCAGTAGVSVRLSGSQAGVDYQLIKNGAPIGSKVSGDGNPIIWPNNLFGAYTIQAIDASLGCTQLMNGTATVSESPLPTQYNFLDAAVTYCSNTTGASIQLISSENGFNFQYQLYKGGVADGASIQGTGNPITWTNKTTGIYSVIATNINTGCSQNMLGTSVVSMLASPSVYSVSGSGSYCEASSGLPVSLSGSQNADINYQLYLDGVVEEAPKPGTSASLVWANKLKGTYTVVATNTINNCSTSMNSSAIISEVVLPTIYDLSGPSSYCEGTTGVTLTLSGSQIGVKYILKDGVGAISTKNGTGLALTWPNTTAGDYTIEAVTTNPIACSRIMNGNIKVTPSALPVASTGGDIFVCLGESKQISASGGVSYSWSPVADLSNPSIANPFATPSASTTYTVTVTDANGCSSTANVKVTVRQLTNVVTSTNVTICKGDSAILTATDNVLGNGETYKWSTGSVYDTTIVKPSTLTTYSVTLTDVFGCKSTASTTVSVNQKPGVNAGSNTEVCKGSSKVLNGNFVSPTGEAIKIWWSHMGENTSSITVKPSTTTQYILKGTYESNGCYMQDTVEVKVNPVPVVKFVPLPETQYCSNGNQVELKATLADGVTPVTGTFSCVEEPTAISVNYFNPAVGPLGTRTINFSHTDANSCIGSASMSLEVVAPPAITITGLNATYCSTSDPFTVAADPLDDGNGDFGEWSFSVPALMGVAVFDNNDGTCRIDPSKITAEGSYTLYYSVKNSSKCIGTANKTFSLKAGPTAGFLGLPATICNNANAITLTGIPGAGTFSGPGILGNTFNPSGLTPGIYTINFSYTDANLCTDDFTQTITVKPLPEIFTVTGGGEYCTNKPPVEVGLSDSKLGVTYTLLRNGAFVGTKPGTDAALNFGSQTLSGNYTVTAKDDATQCSVLMNGSATVTPITIPTQYTLTGPTKYCVGSTGVTLTLDDSQLGVKYILKKDGNPVGTKDGTGDPLTWDNNLNGVYTVEAVNNHPLACTVAMIGSVTVNPVASPVITVTAANGQICYGQTSQLTATGGTTYSWLPDATLTNIDIANPVASPINTTTYTVTVTDANGCSTTGQVQVVVKPLPQAVASPNTTICKGGSAVLTATDNVPGGTETYLWDNGATTDVITVKPATTTTYYVTITDAFSCSNTASTTVTVNDLPVVNAGPDQTICQGSPAILSRSGDAIDWEWSTGEKTASISVSPVITTDYILRGTNALGCTYQDIVRVTVNPLPVVSFDVATKTQYCSNGPSVQLNATPAGGIFSSVTSGAITGDYFNPSVIAPGSHTIKYKFTDLNSCTATASLNVEVLQPTDVTISNVNASYCNTDDPFTVSASPASNTNGVFGTWTFSGPAAAMIPGNGTCVIDPSKITVAGNYTITYNFTNSLGCVSSIPKVFNIKVGPSLSFSGLPATICNNSNPITLSGNQSGAGTFSGPGISGNTFNPAVLTPGIYNIKFTYTDLTTSCVASVTNPVTVNATPKVFTVTGGGSICAGDPGLNIGLSGYEAGIRYELFLNDISTGDTRDGIATAIDFGPKAVPGTYTVKARNIATSCTIPMTGTVGITINPKPLDAQVITGDISVCPGSTWNYIIPEIQNASTYIWDLPAGATISSGLGTRNVSVLFGTASGNIKVYGRNTCGDGKESTLPITVKPLPGAPGAFTSGSATVCQNAQNEVYSIGVISDATSYIWTVPSGATIVSGQGTQTIVVNYGSAALSGNITVKGKNDCGEGPEKILPITVNATPQLTLNAPSGSITCSQTSVTVSASSSTPNATFDWSAINGGNVSGIVNIPGSTSAKANSAGSYIVTVKANSCQIQGTITVVSDFSAPQNVNITATNSGEITCDVPEVTLTATVVGVKYEWTATEGGIVPLGSENFKDIKVSKGGLYELKAINNATGCFTRAWFRVKELKSSPDISVVSPEDEKLTCTKTSVKLYGNSTTGISYKWTGPSENTTSGIVGPDDINTPEVNLSGTYTLVVTDANGCTSSKTVSVLTDYNPIIATVNPNPAKLNCNNLPVTLSGSVSAPGGSILWTGPGVLAGEENVLNPKVNKPGDYSLTVTNPVNGCVSTASVTVGTDNVVPTVSFPEIPLAITCKNTSTTVKSATSALTPKFQWSTTDGAFVSSTDIQNILVSKGGTYTLTVTDEANGCSNTKTIEVIQDIQKPEAIISAPLYLTCNRPEVQLNGISSTTPIKISWTTLDGHFVGTSAPLTLNPSVDKPGTYKMTITDLDNDCPGEVSVTVIEKKTGPVITSFDKTPQVLTCALPEVTLTGNAVGATKLLWTGPVGANISDPANSSTKVNQKGTYTFTATNADGCESSETVTVDENRESPLGLAIVNPGQLNCNSETIKLTGSSTTPLATFKWIALSGNIISADNDKEVTVNAPGDYKMVVTHPSSFCTDSKIVTVSQDKSAPTISFPETPATITCSNKTSDIKVDVTAGSTLQWTGPGSITNVTINGSTVNAAGIYTLKATNPLTGCFISSTIEVPGDKKSPEFTIANPEAISCAKPEIKVHGIPNADLTDYTALWTTVDGTISGPDNGIDVLVKKAGLYTLKLTNNKNGCDDSQNIIVPDNTQKPDIYVDPNPDKITCAVLKVKLYGKTNTGTSMLWSGPGNISDEKTERPEVDAIGDYTLTVTGANGCTNTSVVKVLENKNPPAGPIILDPGKITCNKETVNLELSPVPVNADILWTTTGAGKITNETTFKATVNAIGTYTVTVKDRTSGCPVSKDITITDDRTVSSAQIVGGPYVINCSNGTPILEGTTDTGINPVWTATGGGHILSGYDTKKPTIDAAGTYIFTVTNPITGCKSSDNIVVTKSADLPKLEVKSYPDVLTCTKKQVELWGQPLEAGTTFTWTASPGHFLPGYENIPNPQVDEPGTYILTVTKTSTGCISKAAINVTADITPPQVIVDEPKKFTCLPVPVQLKAFSPEASTSVLWTTSGTGSIKTGDENTWNPTVLTPATYKITVTNLTNQCTTSRDIVVTQDKTLPDIDVDKTPLQLTCTREQVVLSGNSLTSGAIYAWSTTGSGKISNPASKTPAVDAIGTYTLKVTNPLNGCSVTDDVIVIMDDADPDIWVNPTPSILNCIRDTVYLKGNSTTSNVNYLWEGPGIISNPAAKEPFVNAPGVYTLKVTSVANGCYRVLPVTVKKDIRIPEAPLLTGNASCLGAATKPLTAVGNDIQWYNNAALVNESKVQIGNSFSPSGLTAAGDYSFYATQKHPVSQCESPAAQVIYTVRSLPSAPVNINRTICEGDPNTTLTAAGDIIKWYNTPGDASFATGTYTPAVSAPGTYTYFITQTDENNCESPAKDITLTIQPKPAKPVVNQLNATVCFGGVNPVFAAAGTDLKWYTSPSLPAPVKTGGTFTPLETTAGTYAYYVTQTSPYGCVSPYETVTLNIRPVPQAFTVTGGGIYCENTNGLAIGLDGSQMNTSYQLILNGTTVVTSKSGDGAAIDFGLQKAVGNYTVKAIDGNSCEMIMNGGVTIASNPLPGNALTITGPASVCEGAQNVSYSIPAVANANSYTWSIPVGSIITSGLNTRQIAVDFNSGAVTGQISVYANNVCGAGAVSPNLQVIVSPLPKASGDIKNISGNDLVCLGDSGKIYEVDPILNATSYEWVLPAGTTVYSGANSRQIRVKFASNAPTGTQVIKVRGVNSCGAGKFSALYNITVNPNPSVYAGIDQNLCSTQTNLQGSLVPAGGTGVWNQVLGYSSVISNTQPSTQVNDISQGLNIFTWKITYNGCSSTDTVRVYNNKVDVEAGESLPICSPTITLRGSVPQPGTSGVWTVKSGSASFAAASQHNTTVSNFGYGDNKLYWTVTKNGCESRDSITITNYRPVAPDAGADQTICTSNTALDAITPVYGIGKWSVYSGKATFVNNSDPKTAISSVGKGKNKLVWTVTNLICSLSDTVVITNNELDVNAGYDQVICENRTTLEATAAPSGSTGQWSVLLGSASFLDNRINNTKISGLVNGPNKLIWSLTRGSCVNTDTVTIICNMPSVANAGPDQFLGGANTTLEGNLPVVGTGRWSIISGAATFANVALHNTAVTGLNPGANILRWTISYNNCNTFDEVTITNGTIEAVDAGQDQVICTNQTVLEAARPQYGFGIWSVQRGSANFENNETYNTKVTNLATGTNVLRWSVVVSGIEFFDTVTIVNNQPTLAITGPRQILCIDSSALTGNIPIQGTGRWTLEGGSATIHNVNQNTSKVTGLGSGENIFRWTITKGTCVSSTLLVITNDKTTQADAGMDQTICDDKTTLIPSPAYIGTGEWSVVSGSGRFTNNDVSGLATGRNVLRWIIRKNNCSSYDDMVVISHKPTAASAGINTVVCVDSLNLAANRPNSAIGEFGRWTIMNGSGQIKDSTLNTSLITRLAQGVNVLRWTINNHGCISSGDVQINYAFVGAEAGIDMATCNNHIILNANNPTLGKGEWSVVGGSGTAVFTDPNSPNTEVKNLDQGKNILKWTINNFSCFSSSEVIITNNAPSVSFAGGDQSLCINNTTLAARQPFIGKGSWTVLSGSGLFADSSAFNSRVYNIGPGTNTYRWTVRNQNCLSTDEVVVNNNKPIGTYAGLDQVLCLDSARLTANQPIVGNGVWSITKGAGQITDVYNAVTSVLKLAPDTNILRWTVTNKQCMEFQEIEIINNLPTIPSAGADRVLCSDQTTMDGNLPLHGNGEWFVISGSGTFVNKNVYNTEVRGLTLGKNIFRWKISKNGCVLNDDVVLTNDLPTKPQAGTDIAICDNNSPLNANKPVVGKGYWSIVSGHGIFIDSTQHNTRIVGLGQGSNLLTWTTVHNRCALTDVVEVRNNQTNVYAGPDQIVFENSSLLVSNEPQRGLGTWSLNGGGGNISSPNSFESVVTGLEQGINTFLWSVDISGCISSDAVQITYYRIPTASFSISGDDGCPPHQVKFTKTTIENYPYKWYFGDKDSVSSEENPVFTYENPGSYSAKLVVTGPDGKPVEMVKTITVHDKPSARFELVPQKVYLPEGELKGFNYSVGAKDYLWDFGNGDSSDELNPTYAYKDSGTYTVKLKVWSEFGCLDSLTVENGVEVIQSSMIKFPSAFTPNMTGATGGAYNRNDYSNDVFYPIVITGEITEYHLEIYNRWGVLIFESKDINVGWDGYYKDKLMMEDVYIYRVSGRLNNGRKINQAGDFLLMRKDY